MNDSSNTGLHDEITLLLPWYINKTLHEHDQRRVENHTKDCLECRDALSLLRTMETAVTVDSPAPIVPAPRVQDLLDTVCPQAATRSPRRGWIESMAAASIITIAITALLFFVSSDKQGINNNIFETATSTRSAVTMDVVLDIQFETTSDAGTRRTLLEILNAEVQTTSDNGDAVRAILHIPVASLEELEWHTKRIESMSPIRSVKLVALQLPVRKKE